MSYKAGKTPDQAEIPLRKEALRNLIRFLNMKGGEVKEGEWTYNNFDNVFYFLRKDEEGKLWDFGEVALEISKTNGHADCFLTVQIPYKTKFFGPVLSPEDYDKKYRLGTKKEVAYLEEQFKSIVIEANEE